MDALDSKGLDRIVDLDPRDVWKNEAYDFTPWLAEHLDLLSEALMIDELNLIDTEVKVGAFSLDIHAEDAYGDVVVIENQLTPSNHDHLGKLLAYASGLDASYLIWVAPEFRDEHRKTLEWLNQWTEETVSLFAVQVRVVTIGGSPPAPLFDVIVQPNDWGKQLQAHVAGETSPINEQRREFFASTFHAIAELVDGFKKPKPQAQNWNSFRGRLFGSYDLVFDSAGDLRVEVVISAGDPALNDEVFAWAKADADAFQAKVGAPLVWDPIEGKKTARIYVRRPAPDLDQADQVAEAVSWASARAQELIDAFEEPLRGRVKELREAGDAAIAVASLTPSDE